MSTANSDGSVTPRNISKPSKKRPVSIAGSGVAKKQVNKPAPKKAVKKPNKNRSLTKVQLEKKIARRTAKGKDSGAAQKMLEKRKSGVAPKKAAPKKPKDATVGIPKKPAPKKPKDGTVGIPRPAPKKPAPKKGGGMVYAGGSKNFNEKTGFTKGRSGSTRGELSGDAKNARGGGATSSRRGR